MYSISMINTYNESNLHNILKHRAATECKGRVEQAVDSYICDVVGENGEIIEIQTQNLGNITGKILNLLQTHRVKLVYPLAVQTYIEYYTQDKTGTVLETPLSRRKSPKKRNIYHIFDELMGAWPVLLHKNFSLEVIEAVITKKRLRTDKPVQSANKRRRFLRDWVALDTDLESILEIHTFNSADDYTALLPSSLNDSFTIKELRFANKECIKNEKLIKTHEQAGKMIWTLHKMGLIECIGKNGRSKVYKRV